MGIFSDARKNASMFGRGLAGKEDFKPREHGTTSTPPKGKIHRLVRKSKIAQRAKKKHGN